jgi:hypothetical protein
MLNRSRFKFFESHRSNQSTPTYRLIKLERSSETFEIHRLIQISTRAWTNEHGKSKEALEELPTRPSDHFPLTYTTSLRNGKNDDSRHLDDP